MSSIKFIFLNKKFSPTQIGEILQMLFNNSYAAKKPRNYGVFGIFDVLAVKY